MGYNWRESLGDYAQVSGVLAGFCFALIVFVLSWNTPVCSTSIYGWVTYRDVSVLLIGIASVLFIASMEFFMTAKEFDPWGLPDRWYKYIVKNTSKREWKKREEADNTLCRSYEKLGRRSYNIAIFFVFIGFFFVIAPFNGAVATLVSGLGIFVELVQVTKGITLASKRS